MHNRQDRIYQETNTSVAGNLQVLNFVAGEGQAINDGLAQIPAAVYPENPGSEPLIPNIDKVGGVSFLTKVSTWLSPVTFVMGWANTWENIKRYAKDENKNFEKTLDLGMNVLTTAASTTIMALILAGTVYAAPYLIAGMLGAGMAYGFFNIMKHSYRAYRAHKEGDKEKRNAHLWAVPKQMLSTAVNALGFVLNLSMAFHIGPQLSAAASKLTTAIKNWDLGGVAQAMDITKSAGSAFAAAKTVLYGLAAVATLGAVPSLTAQAFKNNAETLDALKHPVQTLKKAGNAIKEGAQKLWSVVKKRPYLAPFVVVPVALEIVSLSAQAVSRVASLALAPVQIIGKGITKAFGLVKGFFSSKKPSVEQAPVLREPLLQQVNDSTFRVTAALNQDQQRKQAEHGKLKALIADEVAHLKTQTQTKKIQSKLFCMEQFDQKLGTAVNDYNASQSVAKIEDDAKVISPYLKQSFWREVGRVEKISQHMQRFEHEMQKDLAEPVSSSRRTAPAA
jgi:hypothetical protein